MIDIYTHKQRGDYQPVNGTLADTDISVLLCIFQIPVHFPFPFPIFNFNETRDYGPIVAIYSASCP